MASFNKYRGRLVRSTIDIKCLCGDIMKLGKYPSHTCEYTTWHGGKRNKCPWMCNGKIKWKQGEKHLNADHLINCMELFISKHKIIKMRHQKIEPQLTQELHEIDPILNLDNEDLLPHPKNRNKCVKCLTWYENKTFEFLQYNMLGRLKLKQVTDQIYDCNLFAYDNTKHSWLDKIHETENTNQDDVISQNEIQFNDNSGLNDAQKWVQLYEYFRPLNYYWSHIAIRACAFENFIKTFSPHTDEFCLLPYSCLCDGESVEHHNINYTTHRHMIIVSKSIHIFDKLWKKIQNSSNNKYDRFKVQTKIRDVLHLLHCIAYVSNTKSQCNGVTIDRYDEIKHLTTHIGYTHKTGQHHYHISQPVPPHAVVALCTILYPNVIIKYTQRISLNVTLYIERCERLYDKHRNNVWHTTVKELVGDTIRNCLIPFARRFYITDERIPIKNLTPDNIPSAWICDMDNHLVTVRENRELEKLSDEQWIEFQQKHNNKLMNRYDNFMIQTSITQQRILNAVEYNMKNILKDIREKDNDIRKKDEIIIQKDIELKRLMKIISDKIDDVIQ